MYLSDDTILPFELYNIIRQILLGILAIFILHDDLGGENYHDVLEW